MRWTIARASQAIAAREISPVELTEDCLARIEAVDPDINAFVTVTAERAMRDARAAEARILRDGPLTPLDGIPIAHKDLFETAGIRTTAQSRLLQTNVPDRDAAQVRRLDRAGTVMLGKLATLEFALAGPSFDLPWPPARNPWNREHFTSGSSSGTAAAIAAGMILGGTGSDTGGSVRGPAAMCGTSGIKPSFGLCSRDGLLPLAPSLDQPGPMAIDARDCAMLLQQMAGHDPGDPCSVARVIPDYTAGIGGSLRGLKIGVIRHFHETDHPAGEPVLSAIDRALTVLREAGATIRDIRLRPLQHYSACNKIIMNAEAAAIHRETLRHRFHDYGERLRMRLALAALIPATDYIEAQRVRSELCEDLGAAMREVDVVVTANAALEAPRIDDVAFWDGIEAPSYTVPWNLSGLPSLAVPMGFGPNGLPIGIQLGGRMFDEATLFRVAAAIEERCLLF